MASSLWGGSQSAPHLISPIMGVDSLEKRNCVFFRFDGAV